MTIILRSLRKDFHGKEKLEASKQALPLNYRHKNRYTKYGSTLLGTTIGMSGGLAIAGMLGVAYLIFKRNMH